MEPPVDEETDQADVHVPNASWEPWQWKRYEWEKNGKIGGTAALLVQPHCRRVDNLGSVFVREVCVCIVISNGAMVFASTLFKVFPKLTSLIASGRLLFLQQQWGCVFKISTGGEVRYGMHHLRDAACLSLMCRFFWSRRETHSHDSAVPLESWSTHLVKATAKMDDMPTESRTI